MDESKFRTAAKKAVVDYWNGDSKLVAKFGKITNRQVYVVWQVKVLENNKALLAANVDGDGMYFEYTYNGTAHEAYFDAYKKQKNIVIPSGKSIADVKSSKKPVVKKAATKKPATKKKSPAKPAKTTK